MFPFIPMWEHQLMGGQLFFMQILFTSDRWKDVNTLHAAYNDHQGVAERWAKNSLRHAFRTLGSTAAQTGFDGWDYEAVVNSDQHQVGASQCCHT